VVAREGCHPFLAGMQRSDELLGLLWAEAPQVFTTEELDEEEKLLEFVCELEGLGSQQMPVIETTAPAVLCTLAIGDTKEHERKKKAKQREKLKLQQLDQSHPDASTFGKFVTGAPWLAAHSDGVREAMIRAVNAMKNRELRADKQRRAPGSRWLGKCNRSSQVLLSLTWQAQKFPHAKRTVSAYKEEYKKIEKTIKDFLSKRRAAKACPEADSGGERCTNFAEDEPPFFKIFVETGRTTQPLMSPPLLINNSHSFQLSLDGAAAGEYYALAHTKAPPDQIEEPEPNCQAPMQGAPDDGA